MKKIKIFYFTSTVLLSLFMLSGAIPDLFKLKQAVNVFELLGYPEYLLPFLGVAKLAGASAILIPGYHRIKEWAYAGMTFDLVGAAYSNLASGKLVTELAPIYIGMVLIFFSYYFWQRKIKGENELTQIQVSL